jgi:hypothetical protein
MAFSQVNGHMEVQGGAYCKTVGYPTDFRFGIVMRVMFVKRDRVCLPDAAPSRKNKA